jgi:mono/diheme cytochrome c family protein
MPMEVTRRLSLALLILVAVAIAASSVRSQKSATAPAQSSDIERGKYLVNEVAKCQECHTPRDDRGNMDYTRDLQGAPIWIVPVHPDTTWAMRAPAIAGLPQFTDAQAETILEKGIGPNGLPIQPPMHIYHMNHADSTAIVAYLRSMPSAYPRN